MKRFPVALYNPDSFRFSLCYHLEKNTTLFCCNVEGFFQYTPPFCSLILELFSFPPLRLLRLAVVSVVSFKLDSCFCVLRRQQCHQKSCRTKAFLTRWPPYSRKNYGSFIQRITLTYILYAQSIKCIMPFLSVNSSGRTRHWRTISALHPGSLGRRTV